MTQVVKNDVNQIFANDAPAEDKPPSFNNYTQGWNESRSNNGKPTIKQMNFIQQRNDNNMLWIHQNGGALPYDASIEYNDGVIVLKDGKLQQLSNDVWSEYTPSQITNAVPQLYIVAAIYSNGSRILLDDKRTIVISKIDNNTSNPNKDMTNWELESTVRITTSLGVSADTWLSNLAITPDLFLTQANNDDLTAFYLACDKAKSLKLPVTLLARTYNINGSIDLRKSDYGIVTASHRFSATILKATSNPNSEKTFVLYQNMDRTKIGNFRIDVNGLFSIGLDTSYPDTGPSLNITFENIMINNYVDIAWLAGNNSDVYFENCTIIEPHSSAPSSVVTIKCITNGGPAQFNCCNLLGGKLQVSSQHTTTIMCVMSGVEFMGGSWNVYSATGTHHFGSMDTNSCFTIGGEVRGFIVNGGLCEANNGGYLFNGTGSNNVLTGNIEFNGTQVKADQGKLYLSKGTVGTKFGTLICRFVGGFAVIDNPSSIGFFDDISYKSTNNGTIVITKDVNASAGDLRNYSTSYGLFSTDKYAQLGDTGVFYVANRFYFLQGSGGYFGIASPYSNVFAQGILKVTSSDGKNYAEYRLASAKSSDGTSINYGWTELINTSTTTKKINLYYDGGNIQVFLDNEDGESGTKKLYFSFDGFIGKI